MKTKISLILVLYQLKPKFYLTKIIISNHSTFMPNQEAGRRSATNKLTKGFFKLLF